MIAGIFPGIDLRPPRICLKGIGLRESLEVLAKQGWRKRPACAINDDVVAQARMLAP